MATIRLRLDPKVRKAALLKCAIDLSAKHGIRHITRDMIAAAGDASPGLVTKYLGNMDALRNTVFREGVKQKIIPIVAQGIAERNKAALKAPPELKQQAIEYLARQ